jgi:hypothetical protein
VHLIAGAKTLSEPLKVVMDPRVKTATAELEEQFRVSKAIYNDALRATTALHEITVLREQLNAKARGPATAGAGESIESKLTKIAGKGGEEGGGPRRGSSGPPNLTALRLQLARMEYTVQSADVAPTTAQVEGYEGLKKPLADLLEEWRTLKANDVHALNESLRKAGLPMLSLDTRIIDHGVEDQIEMGDDD